MIGSSEAGLAETIDYVLKMFNESEQFVLANSVFLTGGCSNFSGKSHIIMFYDQFEDVNSNIISFW